MIVRPYGTEAVLVDLDDAAAVGALCNAFDAGPPPGVLETMPGLRTVLVRFDPRATDGARVAAVVGELVRAPAEATTPPAAPREVTVRVGYDGVDLAEVAGLTGLTAAEVVAAHLARTYVVVLIGLAPGFYFLAGGDPRLRVPRRRTPRTDVPKGAVGLAGELTGVYPRLGPGGWQLIGTVVDDLWHATALPAATLPPGTLVRFEPA